MADFLEKLDAWVYRIERGFVVAALVVMSVAVFLDVVHRTFASEENKFVEATAKLAGFVGTEIQRNGDTWQSLEGAAPYILWIGFSGLTYFGIRTATRRDPIGAGRALLYAVIGVMAAYGIIRLFLRLFPSGLIWSQDLALVLTLWVGFIGASMCTYENKHLKVEAVQRYLPPGIKRIVVAASGFVTTGVCVVLLWVSLRYLGFHYVEYADTDGQGGVITSLDWPKWQAFAALPISFAIMGARFAARAVSALLGNLPDDDPVEGLVEELAPSPTRKPSEVPTEVSGRKSQSEHEPRPSEVPTEAVRVSGDGEEAERVRQSDVPTEAVRVKRPATDEEGAAVEQFEPPERPKAASLEARSGEIGEAPEDGHEDQDPPQEQDEDQDPGGGGRS